MNSILPKNKLILLKHLDNRRENDSIPNYFAFHYRLDIDECIKEFWNNHLITYASVTDTLKHCTIQQLKSMLSEHGLSVSGNKGILIERLAVNVDENTLFQNLDKYIIVTDEGKKLLESLSDDDWNNRFPIRPKLSDEERFKQRFVKSINELELSRKLRVHLPVRYTVHTVKDITVCEYCKSFEGRELDIKDAVVGINYPPFEKCTCSCCRCFTVSEIMDK